MKYLVLCLRALTSKHPSSHSLLMRSQSSTQETRTKITRSIYEMHMLPQITIEYYPIHIPYIMHNQKMKHTNTHKSNSPNSKLGDHSTRRNLITHFESQDNKEKPREPYVTGRAWEHKYFNWSTSRSRCRASAHFSVSRLRASQLSQLRSKVVVVLPPSFMSKSRLRLTSDLLPRSFYCGCTLITNSQYILGGQRNKSWCLLQILLVFLTLPSYVVELPLLFLKTSRLPPMT